MSIKVIINGANGKMGRTTVEAIEAENDLKCVAKTGRNDNLAQAINQHSADVVIDFTLPDSVYKNAQTIIENGARPVIGTSGLSMSQIDTLKKMCREKKRGGIIAPNFSIGALLMMRYAKDAAQYFPDVEIIEMHHPHKVDAPSGTAKKTAELIAENKSSANVSAPIDKTLKDNVTRGEHHHGVPIHAVRLTGIFATQQVIFGNAGERFTIQHDSIDRHSMMPGVFLCCRKVMSLDHLVYGMEGFV